MNDSQKAKMQNDFRRVMDLLGNVNKMVVAVKLPTGATELIINTEQIGSKVAYYVAAYDDDMKLKVNPNVQVISWMFA